MNWLTIIACHLLLVTIALALPANKIENKSHEATTIVPSKDTKTKLTKEQVDKSNKKLGKSSLVAQKRDIPQLFEETPDDIFNNGKSAEDYAKAFALKPSLDNSRIENAILKSEAYGDPVYMNDYRYYGGEDRKKRTAIFDLYNRPGLYSKRELSELTPDQVLTLLALMQQQQRINYPPPQSRYWSDIDNSIDLPETDLEDEDVSNEYPENRFDDLYDRRFLPRWGNFAKDKRFMVSKRSSFSGK